MRSMLAKCNPAIWRIAILAGFLVSTRSQPTVTTYTPFQPLPTTPLPPVNSSGTFLWPVTRNSQIFSAGSVMNISWNSEISQVNLWAVPNFDWDNPTSLTSNAAASYFEWTVSCGTECDVPWLIRAVDARGDQNGQRNGGFVSAEFWIQDPDGGNARTTTTATTAATSESDASVTSSTSVTSVLDLTSSSSSSSSLDSSIPAKQDKGNSITTSASTYAPASTIVTSIPSLNTPSISPELPSNQNATAQEVSTGLGKEASIGIGVGVGAGIAVTAMLLTWALVCRTSKRKHRSRAGSQGSIDYPMTSSLSSKPKQLDEPVELRIQQTPRMFHEAPGWSPRPQELGTS